VTRKSSAFAQLLGSSGSYFGTAGAFSLAINLLYLAGPLYMLQVYDRVVPSSSEVTLLMLTLGLVLAYLTLAGLDAARARVLTRASVRLDQRIAPRIMTAIIDRPASAGGARSQLLRDFDGFRQFHQRHRHSRDFRPAVGADLHRRDLHAALGARGVRAGLRRRPRPDGARQRMAGPFARCPTPTRRRRATTASPR